MLTPKESAHISLNTSRNKMPISQMLEQPELHLWEARPTGTMTTLTYDPINLLSHNGRHVYRTIRGYWKPQHGDAVRKEDPRE